MPGGKAQIRHEDGKSFTTENQPENRGRKPSFNIVEEVVAIMEGDAWMVVDGERLNEQGKPTGEMVKVRFKAPTVAAAARAWASKVSKADPRLLEMYLDRTLGKVPQTANVNLNTDPAKYILPDGTEIEL